MTTSTNAPHRCSGITVSDACAIDILHDLVSTPSLSGQESAVAQRLVVHMRALGLEAHIDDAGNAVGMRTAPGADANGACDIVLLGHMDTVPGDIPVRIEGDLLHGRGSVDAKGPLATLLLAAATAAIPAGVRLIIIGAVEEEASSSRGARHIAPLLAPRACIIGEPSGFDGVTLGYKGRLIAENIVSRESSHSAGPGATAAEVVVDWWLAMRDLARVRSEGCARVFDQVQASLRSCDTKSDGLHDTARAVVGFRLPPGVDPRDFEQACRERTVEGELTFTSHERAHLTNRADPIVRHFTSAIRASGAEPRPRIKTGTSDMNVVAPIWTCPIVAYGPGDSALDHTPHEHISLSEFLRSISVLRTAIESLATEIAQAE